MQHLIDACIHYINEGRLADARAAVAACMVGESEAPEDLHSLGILARRVGIPKKAASLIGQAVSHRPTCSEYLFDLAKAWLDCRDTAKAVYCFRLGLDFSPRDAAAWNNLAACLASCEEFDQALSAVTNGIRLNPDSAAIHATRARLEFAVGEIDRALADYREAVRLDPNNVKAYSNFLYSLYFHPAYSGRLILTEHQRWVEHHALHLAQSIGPHGNIPRVDRQLRIGYVSPYFSRHCQSFFTTPLLANHDRVNFRIFAYYDSQGQDATTHGLRSLFDDWREVAGASDENVAQVIRDDRIDILIDLTMHMGGGRPLLFARKPAPVQVAWLAYPGTTGLPTIDYRLTDPYLDPSQEDDADYAEESFRLPDSYWCFDPLSPGPGVSELPCLTSDGVTFGCLNNFAKVNESVMCLWGEVLAAVKCSRLVILAGPGRHRQRVITSLGRYGIESKRIVFVDKMSRVDYLKFYRHLDVTLDPFPANGHTTTLDSLWMGVPVVTLAGRTAISRGARSILCNVGLPELVAVDPAGYVKIVADLVRDLPRLRNLRSGLRDRLRESPLMDAPRFARSVEEFYRTAWERWCRGV